MNHTWSKLDIVAMAKKAELGKIVVPGYYYPMRQSHATVYAILSRLIEENGRVRFSDDPQRDTADEALRTAHLFILAILDLQKKHFKLEFLNEPVEKCEKDIEDILPSTHTQHKD